MNMRQHKRWVMARQLAPWALMPLGHRIMLSNIQRRMNLAALVEEPAVEEAKQEFVCQRVKDGEVVATFDLREDALALVLKHAKQRKAKLEVLDSSTGELVLFSEEEVA